MEQNTGRSRTKKEKKYLKVTSAQITLMVVISLFIGAVLSILVLAGRTTRFRIADVESKYDASLISELLEEIDKYYYFSEDAPDSQKLREAAAKSVVEAIGDRYAAYYTDEEYADFRNQMNGNYKGIGVLVSPSDDGKGMLVTRSYENNNAYNAGVRDGDIIVKIDGKSLEKLSFDESADLIIGEDGTKVKLEILRDGKKLEFEVERGDVHTTQVFSRQLEDNIGYICIESFTGDAATAFNEHLDKLLGAGIKSLIIDIRNNPGGSLDIVVAIADRVLPDCLITTIEGRLCNPPEEYKSSDEQKLEIPYVVLVNGNSASASEVFSSAVQDNKQAKIIGTTTFGKGIVQTSWSLGNGMGFIKLTTDAYRTPSGRLIHGIGVVPDIEVEQDAQLEGVDPYFIMRDAMERDLQLKAAVDELTK